MKRILSLMICGCLAVGILSGCGSSTGGVESAAQSEESREGENEGEESFGTGAETEETDKEPVEVKIWHDGDEAIMTVIETTVNEELRDQKISISFEKKAD